MFAAPPAIDLEELARGTACLTPAVCANLAEAAAVCLTTQKHEPGVALRVGGALVRVAWGPLDGRAADSHADPQEATEEGAVAVAIELIRRGTPFDVVRRSRKGPGFDWYLGANRNAPPFAESACLEVSGILDETPTLLEERAKRKVAQAQSGGSGLPGFAVVVGFAGPRAIVRSLP